MNGQDLAIKFNELLSITQSSYDAFLAHTEKALRESRPLPLAVDEDAAEPSKLQMDMALLQAAPVAVVPVHSEFAPLEDTGHRFLMAQDGVYLEVRRPWLHFIQRLVEQKTVRMPFGRVEPRVTLAFGSLGTALAQMREFGAYASAESPIEAAASVIWKPKAEQPWEIRYPEIIGAATASSIQYKQVDLAEDEHLVLDLHSHGAWPAMFSETDNIDDAGSVKIAGVFGQLDQPMPSVAFRLCVLGMYIPISVPAEKIFELTGEIA